jgi:hypothetical protein
VGHEVFFAVVVAVFLASLRVDTVARVRKNVFKRFHQSTIELEAKNKPANDTHDVLVGF